eukprot:Em1280g1a
MAKQRPLLLPEPFSGEASSNWDEWLVYFENCAAVNSWESDEEKLKWIRVRLTGKAQTALQRFLQMPTQSIVAFSVRQRHPQTVDEAASAPIEVESYVRQNFLNIVGVGRSKLHLTGIPTPLDASMLVVEELAVEAILGLDFLERHKCAIGFPMQEAGPKHSPTQIGLVLTQKLVLPALSESEIMASLEKTVEDGRSWIVYREPSDRMGVLVAHALVCPANNAVPLRVLSPREEPVIVPKGTRIATLEALDREPPDDVIQVHAVSATGNKSLSSSEEGVLWEMVSKIFSEVISIDLMVKLSRELSTITPQQLEVLGCALGCTNTDIGMMLRCSSMQECILSQLQRWVRNYHLPTTEKLAQALKKSGCLDKTNRLISS